MDDLIRMGLTQQFILIIIAKTIKIAFVIFIAYFIFHMVTRIVARVINLRFNQLTGTQQRRTNTLLSMAHSILGAVFAFITVMMVLTELSIDTTSLLAGASIIGLAIGVGAQSLVKDFVAGAFIIMEDQYSIGDIVTIKGFTGTVTDVSLRTTKICSSDKVVHTVPNGMIDIVSNYTKGIYIATVRMAISQEVSPDVVLPILKQALDEVGRRSDVHSDGAAVGGITSMDGNNLIYEVSIPARKDDSYDVCASYRYEVAKRLSKAHISFAKFAVDADFSKVIGADHQETKREA